MAHIGTHKAMVPGKPAARAGRPTVANAGEVEERLLHAATGLFLERGFEATSCDLVAARAGAGKGSLYARFANKEELFAAVIRRAVARSLQPATTIAAHLPLKNRLQMVGIDILRKALMPDALAMMRLVITTAARFPELAQLADSIGWDRGVNRVAEVLTMRTDRHPVNVARAMPASAWFISLTFAPQQMRALLGDSQEALHASAPKRVEDAVTMLDNSGWLAEWE